MAQCCIFKSLCFALPTLTSLNHLPGNDPSFWKIGDLWSEFYTIVSAITSYFETLSTICKVNESINIKGLNFEPYTWRGMLGKLHHARFETNMNWKLPATIVPGKNFETITQHCSKFSSNNSCDCVMHGWTTGSLDVCVGGSLHV